MSRTALSSRWWIAITAVVAAPLVVAGVALAAPRTAGGSVDVTTGLRAAQPANPSPSASPTPTPTPSLAAEVIATSAPPEPSESMTSSTALPPDDDCPAGDHSGDPRDGSCGDPQPTATASPSPTTDACPRGDLSGSPTDGTCTAPAPAKPQPDQCPQGDESKDRFDGTCAAPAQADACPGGDTSGSPTDGICTAPAPKAEILSAEMMPLGFGSYTCRMTWTGMGSARITSAGREWVNAGPNGTLVITHEAPIGEEQTCDFWLNGTMMKSLTVSII